MANRVRYYISRVIKLGMLKEEGLLEAILHPVTQKVGDFNYTFTEIKPSSSDQFPDFIYARLAKFRPSGEVGVVEPGSHDERVESVDNLLEKSSPFIYVPRYSIIAFRPISGKIEKHQFENRFTGLVEAKYNGLFVQCHLEPIIDLRTFVTRLGSLNVAYRLTANIHPPNPLFGLVWKSLKEYLEKRRIEEATIIEKSKASGGIDSKLQQLARAAAKDDRVTEKLISDIYESAQLDVGDAAVLMAADGYGDAEVEGNDGRSHVIIRTGDSHKSFLFDSIPDAEALNDAVLEEITRINAERGLRHEHKK